PTLARWTSKVTGPTTTPGQRKRSESHTLQAFEKVSCEHLPQLLPYFLTYTIYSMAKQTHYVNAPITEAVIDIRVRVPEKIGTFELEEFYDKESGRYPNKKELKFVEARFTAGEQISAAAKQLPHGFAYTNEDKQQIAQVQLNGFTFSRLQPYQSWEPFRDEGRRLWEVYRDLVQPEMVTRMAVRYINRLDLPLPLSDFKDYLRTVPEVAPDLPQGLAGYFMHLTIPYEDIQSTLLLNQAIIQPKREGVVSVVLDIDLFRKMDRPDEEQEMWHFFETLHERKNDIFEACITDRTRELIA
ncbi:MAG: TIGR04255 family protein, partial [Bacteroidetes bacterium]|nr:TIGR04255 family protein [Bacteroidota bacterium]